MGPASWLGALMVRLLGATWRIERGGVDPYRQPRGPRERCIFVFWHSGLVPLVYTHRGHGAVVLIGRHLDGEIVARVLQRLGYVTARGSSTRGGEHGMLGLLSGAAEGRDLALTPDGPRGPAERMKPGAPYVASRSGLPVIALAAASDACWSVRSWDRLRIPRPFARVRLEFSPPIAVPAELDDSGLEEWRARLEAELHAVTGRARAAAREQA